VSLRAILTFDWRSVATNETSTLLFEPTARSRPFSSIATTTDAFFFDPFRGAANRRIVRPLTGSGLFSASSSSFSSFPSEFGFEGLALGAAPGAM